jgi:hypothetical protein
VKSPFKDSFGSSGYEHYAKEVLKQKKCDPEIIDLGSLKLNVK